MMRFTFAYDGGLGEGAGVGLDEGTPVTEEYGEGDNAFTGKIVKVTVEVGAVGVAERPAIDNAVKALAVKKALSD
jgi:hypothetical protein